MSSTESQTTSNPTSTTTSIPPFFPPTFNQSDTVTSTSTHNNGGFSGNTGPQVASSSALYLYTFLATLVLLLSVSAAIILRSLLLRRRHRRMVDEAMANGTWVPPSPGARGFGAGRTPRVDLSRKPKMWEAFIRDDAAAPSEKGSHSRRDSEWDWDSIRPFSVSYARAPLPPALPLPLPELIEAHPRVPLTQMLRQIISPTPSRPTILPESQSSSPPSRAGSTSDLLASDGPRKVTVAVLIAMPSQAHPHVYPASASSHPLQTHVVSQLQLDEDLRKPLPSSLRQSSSSPVPQYAEEPELPHLEFGVAELVIRQDHDAEDGSVRGKGERGSVESSSDVV